ncbi:MAG TPA: N-acetylmuramoyl-L-alanine amidase [Gaiellaceae bacterium]|nr:N-acetylmuramoyl-L-alanine amidase [Gaiellaceae bacterium]
MRRSLALLSAALVAAWLAPGALAAIPAKTRAVVLERSAGDESVRYAEGRFTLAGVHWRGSGKVSLRTRSVDGRWTPWRDAAPEDEDGPDWTSSESRLRSSFRVGNPFWVGPSDRVEVRVRGQVTGVRAYLVWSPETWVPVRRPAAVGAPTIVPRLSWGADESIRRYPPSYAPELRFAIVHHTAGRNDYTRAAAPAIVKAIQLYHVQGNGWNDIGYNFLVDRFGTIYEGRFGGVDRNVVGAHAAGFNTGSVGVAVLGTYGSTSISKAAEDALARLLAWRLDLAHVDPTGSLTAVSGGNERFVSGVPVSLRVVSGHRDAGSTECPGNALYAKLGALASAAGRLGLPKIYEPVAEASGAEVRFTARVSAAIAWSVVVSDAAGTELARGLGTGPTVDWTWDAAGAPPGTYRWSIAAGTALPATGSVRAGGAATLAVVEAAAAPSVISPNGDGQADSATLGYRLTTAANVTVQVVDAEGVVVATPVDRVWSRAGPQTAVVAGETLPDGTYTVVITARTASGSEASAAVSLSITRTLGAVALSPVAFSPNEDRRNDRLSVTFTLTVPAEVRLKIVREGRWVATPFRGALLQGTHRLEWDGRRPRGVLKDGPLEAVVEVVDLIGTISYAVPFTTDRTAPVVRFVPGRRLRVEVSEPAALVLRVDGVEIRRTVKRAGIVRVPWAGAFKRARVVAWDQAGNVSVPALRITRPGPRGTGQ